MRAQFEGHARASNPREMETHLRGLEQLEKYWRHPQPYVPPSAPGGSKFERFAPPRLFTELERQAATAWARPKFSADRDPYPEYWSEAFQPDPHPEYFRKGEIGPEFAKVDGKDTRRVVNGEVVLVDPQVGHWIANETGAEVLPDGSRRIIRDNTVTITGPPGTKHIVQTFEESGETKTWIDGRPVIGQDGALLFAHFLTHADFGNPRLGAPDAAAPKPAARH